MDRNSVIGLLLIGLVFIGFSIWNQPSKEQVEAMQHKRDSVAAVEKINEQLKQQHIQQTQAIAASTSADTTSVSDSAKAVLQQQALGDFATAATGSQTFYSLENKLVKVNIGSKGGRVYSVQLKDFKSFEGNPLILFDSDSTVFGLNFFSQNKTISTNDLYFAPVEGASKNKIAMRLNAGDNKFIEYTYSLSDDSYQVKYNVRLVNMNDLIAANTNYLELDWRMNVKRQERDAKSERVTSTIYYRYADEEVDKIAASSSEQVDLKTKVKWVAFKQHFFSSVLIADDTFDKPTKIETHTNENSNDYVKYMRASFTIPYTHKTDEAFAMSFYFGPNHFQTLKKMNLGLEETIPLGFFGFVNKWLVIPVFNWLDSFNISYGIIILILTLMIRIILLPLTYRSFLSQAKMKVLQPEVTELNEKYPDDPMKKQQETMALYRRAGVNPLGGCIPGLLQIPILFAMFSFFPASIELRQQAFLWAKDLSTYDSIASLPFTIPFYGNHVSLFTLLMTASTLAFTAINMQMTTAANPQMKWMMYLMPVMFLGVFNSYSAGLSYYYFLSNMCGLGQQYLFKAFVNQDEIHRKIQENKKKPVTKSKFQQRLEKMAKEKGYQLPKK